MTLRLAMISACAVLWTLPAQAQVRVVTWNVAQIRGEPAAISEVIEALDADDRAGFATPVAILLCQEVTQDSYDTLLGVLGADWSVATYTNDNEDNYGGAQACFYRPTIVVEDPTGHDDLYTQAGRRCDRWQFSLTGYDALATSFFVYSAHLKAGNNSSAETDRQTGANRILQDLAKLPLDTRAIVVGDMNFYDNNELGYLAFIGGGLIDPLGTGSWGGDSGAIKHSQSPRTIASGGLASGGLDDRFDFQLHTEALSGDGGLSLMAGTYRSVGNDGNHYNDAINDGINLYFPDDPARSLLLADALHEASDHLPVAADYRIPAILNAADDSCQVGTVIAGGSLECEVMLANAAAPAVEDGAASLVWALSGTGACQSNVASGSLAPGASELQPILIDTSGGGDWSGTIEVSSDDSMTSGAPATIHLEGTALRPANPSFSSSGEVTITEVAVDVDADTGTHDLMVPIWNLGWDLDQARLDIDAASTSPPVSCAACEWTNISGFPASFRLSIDTAGLSAGELIRWVVITASDQDLPGESETTMHLTVRLVVSEDTVPCQGDVDGDGVTGIGDLLALLDAWGSSGPVGDLDGNGTVDVEDLLAVIADFGCG